jgi:hypothetical protein
MGFCRDGKSTFHISIHLLWQLNTENDENPMYFEAPILIPGPPLILEKSPKTRRDAIGQVEGKEAETIFLTSGYCGWKTSCTI